MIDLTNKKTEEVNALILKYGDVLQLIHQRNEIPYLAVVIDVGITYIKEKYNDLELDWKAWAMVLLKHSYLRGNIKKEEDIAGVIDAFVLYYKDDYREFVDALGISSSDYDRDYGFVCKYLNKKG